MTLTPQIICSESRYIIIIVEDAGVFCFHGLFQAKREESEHKDLIHNFVKLTFFFLS